MAALTKLRETDFIPFIDTSDTRDGTWVPTYKRIDLSTIFSLRPNPHSTSVKYISEETPREEIDYFAPDMEQEIAIYEGNPIYDYMFDLFYNLNVGVDIQKPCLLCFGGTGKLAWRVDYTTLVLGELNPVDGKLMFTMKFGGTITRGTYVITDGVPVFTAA